MEMNKITIKIDLSIFFNDERQKAVLMFNPDWNTVECLQKRVEALFGLQSIRFLSDDGCFIPPQESIEVIKFCSPLKAFIHTDSLEKKRNKKKKKAANGSESEAIIDESCGKSSKEHVSQKKRKYPSLEICSDSPTSNRAKRIKNDERVIAALVRHSELANKSSEISSTSEQMPPPVDLLVASTHSTSNLKKSKSKKTNSSMSPFDAVTNNSKERPIILESSSSTDDLKTESSPAHACTTLVEAKTINNDGVVNTPAARLTSLPSSTFLNESKTLKKSNRSTNTSTPLAHSIPKTKHVYYDESGEITTTTNCSSDKKEEDIETKVVFQCALTDVDVMKPRIFKIQPLQLQSKSSDKKSIEIQENILLKPLDVQEIINKSQIVDAKQDKTNNESPKELLLLSFNENTKDTDKTDLITQKDQSTADEGNCSLNNTNTTAITAIDKYKEFSMGVSSTLQAATAPPDTNKKASIDVSSTQQATTSPTDKESSTDASSQLQGNETNGHKSSSSNMDANGTKDSDVSMDLTCNRQDNETSVVNDENESSVVSVDCVDLSIDLDDDNDNCTPKSKSKLTKSPEDISNYDSSDVEEVSEVIDLNETEDPSNSFTSTSFGSKSKHKGIKFSKISKFCTKMTELPEIGDVIIFKVPYVSRKGTTCTTMYLTGEAQYINKRTKSIKLLILDGHSELFYIPDKFHSNVDNSICEEKFVQMKSSDMIEPKIWKQNKR